MCAWAWHAHTTRRHRSRLRRPCRLALLRAAAASSIASVWAAWHCVHIHHEGCSRVVSGRSGGGCGRHLEVWQIRGGDVCQQRVAAQPGVHHLLRRHAAQVGCKREGAVCRPRACVRVMGKRRQQLQRSHSAPHGVQRWQGPKGRQPVHALARACAKAAYRGAKQTLPAATYARPPPS